MGEREWENGESSLPERHDLGEGDEWIGLVGWDGIGWMDGCFTGRQFQGRGMGNIIERAGLGFCGSNSHGTVVEMEIALSYRTVNIHGKYSS